MIVTRVTLKRFRNYDECEIRPCAGITALVGDNAQGKTNALEAVYLCCTGRSHRTPRDKELIQWEAPRARVLVTAERLDGTHAVEIALTRGERKSVRVNGGAIARSGELMGHLCGVLFSPEDLRMVKDGPAERRRFIDMELSQVRPSYYYALQRYNRALLQRGQLLRDAALRPRLLETIDAWDEQLAQNGAEIVARRREYIARLSLVAGELHAGISGEREKLSVDYHMGLSGAEGDDLAERLLSALRAAREADVRRGVTSVGPHRDDLVLKLDGKDVRAYGSQGQQRTSALSLKLSELRVMREELGEWPILMLDDVMSELDPHRRRQLLGLLEGVQVLVTCTDVDDLAGAPVDRLYRVAAGRAETADGDAPLDEAAAREAEALFGETNLEGERGETEA